MAHPASYSMGFGGTSRGDKMAEAWGWPLICHPVHKLRKKWMYTFSHSASLHVVNRHILPSPMNFMRLNTNKAPTGNSSSSGTIQTVMINDLHRLTSYRTCINALSWPCHFFSTCITPSHLAYRPHREWDVTRVTITKPGPQEKCWLRFKSSGILCRFDW